MTYMADGIKISIDTLALKQDILKILPAIEAKVSKFLDKHAQAMAVKAKQNASKFKDEGTLTGAISADSKLPLEKHISANTPYAAFIEFGTGRYASAEVSKLPKDWQTYAATFKGQKGGGSFDEMVKRIAEWIGRKSKFGDTALHGTFSVKTKRRTGNKVKNQNADLKLAYAIARSILINGIHAHPYLYPAYKEQMILLMKELPNLLKAA